MFSNFAFFTSSVSLFSEVLGIKIGFDKVFCALLFVVAFGLLFTGGGDKVDGDCPGCSLATILSSPE